jgi:hypothetical protein
MHSYKITEPSLRKLRSDLMSLSAPLFRGNYLKEGR